MAAAVVLVMNNSPTSSRTSPFPLDPSTRWWVLVSNPALLYFGCATLFLCHLPSQPPMKSIGSALGGGCG